MQGNEIPEPEPLPKPLSKRKWDIVYVLPFFARPGRHTYTIKYKNEKEPNQRRWLDHRNSLRRNKGATKEKLGVIDSCLQPEVFFYRCQVRERKEDIPPCKPINAVTRI